MFSVGFFTASGWPVSQRASNQLGQAQSCVYVQDFDFFGKCFILVRFMLYPEPTTETLGMSWEQTLDAT